MKFFKYLAIPLFAICTIGCPAQTATPNAVATLIITAAAQPAQVTIVPVTTTVQSGTVATYTVTVSGSNGVPTGSIQLYNGATLITGASGTLTNGVTTCTVNTNGQAPGTYNISAVFTSANPTIYTSGVPPTK